ncbi:MAG: class I SAM-dependent methyltransferase [Thermoplasmata archaeon]
MPPRRARTHAAVRGFDRAARAYQRGRPEYPDAAVRHLTRRLRLQRGAVVVELGSGTGKLTRRLFATGATVVPVEPTPGMRAEFRRQFPGVPVLDGVAEQIPVPDGIADAVVAAQTFHWFRTRPTLREIARVLRPGGQIGLVWNFRDESRPWVAELSRIMGERPTRLPRTRWRRWQRPFDRGGVPFTRLTRREFRHVQILRPEAVIDRILSVSFVAMRAADERRAIARRIRALLARDPATRGRRQLAIPYRTVVFTSRLTGKIRPISRGRSSKRSTRQRAAAARSLRAAKSRR